MKRRSLLKRFFGGTSFLLGGVFTSSLHSASRNRLEKPCTRGDALAILENGFYVEISSLSKISNNTVKFINDAEFHEIDSELWNHREDYKTKPKVAFRLFADKKTDSTIIGLELVELERNTDKLLKKSWSYAGMKSIQQFESADVQLVLAPLPCDTE